MSRLERYNPNKRGSFQIQLNFYDWELAILIKAIKVFISILVMEPLLP